MTMIAHPELSNKVSNHLEQTSKVSNYLELSSKKQIPRAIRLSKQSPRAIKYSKQNILKSLPVRKRMRKYGYTTIPLLSPWG